MVANASDIYSSPSSDYPYQPGTETFGVNPISDAIGAVWPPKRLKGRGRYNSAEAKG